jgi:DNA gyrase subunit A
MTRPEDEVFAITSSGGVIRTRAGEVKLSGRQTMGVRLMNLAPGDSVVAIARNAESLEESDDENGVTGPAEVQAGAPDVPAGPAEGQGSDMTNGDGS